MTDLYADEADPVRKRRSEEAKGLVRLQLSAPVISRSSTGGAIGPYPRGCGIVAHRENLKCAHRRTGISARFRPVVNGGSNPPAGTT